MDIHSYARALARRATPGLPASNSIITSITLHETFLHNIMRKFLETRQDTFLAYWFVYGEWV